MTISNLINQINELADNKTDFRPLKNELIISAQRELADFKPIDEKMYSNNPIQVIDFFSGAGGTSLGFAALNKIIPAFNFLGGCDIDPISAQTYSHNFGTKVCNLDIRELALDEDKLEAFLKNIGFAHDKRTLLIGCPPCQGFSSHRKKDWNKEEDERNDLIDAFIKIVIKIKPEAVIMENVPEFLSSRYWKHYSKAKKTLESFGYIVKSKICNAAEFGVPQERFRSIVLCMRKEFLLPEGIYRKNEYRTVRDAISKLPKVDAGETIPSDPLHKSANHKKSTIDVIKKVPKDGGSRPEGVGPKCLDKTKGFSDVYGRLFWDKPSITITHYARNPASGRFVHPSQDRGLTAREAANLQSFPFGFEFTGSFDDIYRQIGEAVPPLMSTAIACNILIELISFQPTSEELDNSTPSIESPVSNSFSSVIAGLKTRGRRKNT